METLVTLGKSLVVLLSFAGIIYIVVSIVLVTRSSNIRNAFTARLTRQLSECKTYDDWKNVIKEANEKIIASKHNIHPHFAIEECDDVRYRLMKEAVKSTDDISFLRDLSYEARIHYPNDKQLLHEINAKLSKMAISLLEKADSLPKILDIIAYLELWHKRNIATHQTILNRLTTIACHDNVASNPS